MRLLHKASFHHELAAGEASSTHNDEASLYVEHRYLASWKTAPDPNADVFENMTLLQSSGKFRSKGNISLGPFKGSSDYATSWSSTSPEADSKVSIMRPYFGGPWQISYHFQRPVKGKEETTSDMAPMRQMISKSDSGERFGNAQFSFNPPPMPPAPTGDANMDGMLAELYSNAKSAASVPLVLADKPIYWTLDTKLTPGKAVARLKKTIDLPMNGAKGHWTVDTHMVVWTTPVNGSGKPDDLPAVAP
jgi:hypothetical protein